LDSVSQKPGGYAEDRFPEPGSGSILMPWQLDREPGVSDCAGLLAGPVDQGETVPLQSAFSVLEVPELRGAVVRRNIRDIVAEKIASLIASGILQVGDVVPGERDLALALSVSRETVRGAMQNLAARGIIEVTHGARTRVKSTEVGTLATRLREPKLINSYDIEAIHAARLQVERPVVVAAAERIDAETLSILEEALAVQRAAIDDPVRFLISDREFHLAIYRSCGNPVLADFVSDLYTYMMEHRRKAMARPGAILKSLADHVAIVKGLKAHDADAVVAAFDCHLERIYRTTIRIMVERDAPMKTAANRRAKGTKAHRNR
jgi:DNA-binding FadR family transcriptional regulator